MKKRSRAALRFLRFRFLCFYFPVTPRIPLTYFVVICQQEAFLAAEKGQIHKVQSYLIQDHNPNSANEFGDTLLHIAVRHGHKVASNLQHAIRFQALTQWVMLQADGGDASGAWRRRAGLLPFMEHMLPFSAFFAAINGGSADILGLGSARTACWTRRCTCP